MAYSNPLESAMFRRVAAGEPSAAEGWADALNNPAYIGNWEVAEPAMELASGGEAQEKTLTESMAAATISDSASVVSTYASLPRAALPRPTPAHLVLFQRGGPQALEMFQAPLPPAPPAWNTNSNEDHFIYEGETGEPSAPPTSPTTGADVDEEEEQVDAIAEESEEEDADVRTLPAWHLTHNRRRARQVIALLDQNVIDAMPTDDLIWMMQPGFQSLMSRRAHH